MKLKVLIILLFSAVMLYASETLVEQFTAKSDSSNVKVEWRSVNESQVAKYAIERKSASQDFKQIGEVQAKGYSGAYYSYTDETAYKGGTNQTLSTTYSYRLKVVYSSSSETYTNSIDITPSISSVKRTWGMLKELFK